MSEPRLMLRRLSLSGFKTIRQLDIELGAMNVLIGPNGAGKSNLLSFFRLLGHILYPPGALQLHIAKSGGANSLLNGGAAVTPQIEAVLTFTEAESVAEYWSRLLYAAPDTLIFAEEKIRSAPDASSLNGAGWDSLGVGQRESGLPLWSVDADGPQVWQFFADCAVYQFHNTSETARVRQRWSVADNQSLKEDGANLAPLLLRIQEQHPAHYRRITDTLRQIAPFFADFVLVPEGDSILLRWRELGNDVVFGPHQASDGTLRAMALVTLLLQPSDELPAVIILDEPELGLHPRAISILAGLLLGASIHTQVIVATQSPVLLDHFEPEQVIVAERKGAESEFRRLNGEQLASWLEEYTLSELWDKNVLGGRPR